MITTFVLSAATANADDAAGTPAVVVVTVVDADARLVIVKPKPSSPPPASLPIFLPKIFLTSSPC